MRSITVYCSSSVSLDAKFMDAARLLGEEMARRKISLVYGGGSIGLMGEIARTMRSAGGRIIGVITKRLLDLEQGYTQCDELIVVETMAERKKLMALRGEAFIALPGGLGTFEELFEVLVQRQVGEHRKPIGLVNLAGYYNPLVGLIDHGIEHRFIKPAVHHLLHVHEDPISVLEGVLKVEPFEIDPDRFLPMGRG
ncbi:MAG: TIGR00730 family Rossman fold protein [Planctomycetes bacterium]|nr:TIGR00730 family Rossman fold protein [Planctomycetota bacterium]